MNQKKKIIVLFTTLSMLSANLKFESIKFGMSESLGIFGIYNVDYKIEKFSNNLYLTYGFFVFPIFGGAGLTYKKYITNAKPDPKSKRSANLYLTSTIFKYYALALHGDNIASGTIGTIGAGLDLLLFQRKKNKIHIQAGFISQYNFTEKDFFESPSDKPAIWPSLNIKFSR